MTKDKDLRMKLTSEAHRVLGELARGTDSTLQSYVERLILLHINSRLEEARRLTWRKALEKNIAEYIVSVADASQVTSTAANPARLYFVQRGGTSGPIKIGATTSVERRLKALRTGSEESLNLLLECAQAGDVSKRALHRRFRADRMEGEWFKPSPELLDLLDSLTSGNSRT